MIPSQITALLSASYALHCAAIYTHVDIFPGANYAEVAATVVEWANEHKATIELNPEQRTSYIMLEGHRVAILYQPREKHVPAQVAQVEQVDTVVVEPEALRAGGLL